MLVRIPPKVSIEACTLPLLNNSQHWMTRHHPGELISALLDQLWSPSPYAGSYGEVSTALMKWFLARDEGRT